MTDDRWLDVEADVRAALQHFNNSTRLFAMGGFDGDDIEAYRNQMALLHSMSSGYTSLEAAFERIMDLVGEDKPSGSDYHAAILRRLRAPLPGKRPAVLADDALYRAVDETRRFRHVARKSYDDLDVRRAGPAIAAAGVISERIAASIAALRQAVDPSSD